MTQWPDWLPARLPTPEEEIWRYSRIGELDLDEFSPGESSTDGVPDEVRPLLEAVPERAGLLIFRDGHLVHRELAPELEADGGEVVAPIPPTDVFADVNEALAREPVVLRVPKGMALTAPVVVLNWIETDGIAVLPRLVVQAGADSDVTVLDHISSPDIRALVVPWVHLDAGPAARLRYVGVQELGHRVWQLGSLVAAADQDATTLTSAVALGGDYARLRIDSRLTGRGATGDMVAVYFGEGHQMHDFRTFQDHAAPDTTSNLLFKGAVEGHARSVYTGLIKVRPQARGTNAFQTNRNIKLSHDAWAESVPNLEIENNDVRCSHASTVGPIDEDERFYVESRGVPPAVAERLIVIGFFDEVLQQLPVAGLIGPLRGRVAAKLERRDDDAD